jgi:hypothetical protein
MKDEPQISAILEAKHFLQGMLSGRYNREMEEGRDRVARVKAT